jgi:fructose-1,6-bisphosphatase I
MPDRRTTFSKFIIEDRARTAGGPDADLTALLNDIQTACKFIASAVSRGAHATTGKPLHDVAIEIMRRECEWGGQLAATLADTDDVPHHLPPQAVRGRYLLAFDPLDGSDNLDVDVTVGTIFSVLRVPEGIAEPRAEHFLQPGTQQVAAGYTLYGPMSMMVITLGAGVHGFTLDREIGAYTLTHPDMRIPSETREFAINASNRRFWEAPVRHYVEECIDGRDGARGDDFSMRWVDSLVSEVHRILVRGGLFIHPRDISDAGKQGRLHYLYEASPMALIVEQAGGAASTGRERILDVRPATLHERLPVVLGSSSEVARLVRYHEAHDRGEELAFATPLFNARSLFRAG